ncbi:hypothetical protein FOMG_19806, partial [Fusarium oxysporum f. sp. melonis 26406]
MRFVSTMGNQAFVNNVNWPFLGHWTLPAVENRLV